MPKYVFGKSVDYLFVPTIDGEPVKVYSLSTANLYAVEPTEAQIDGGTGYLQQKTAWASEGDYAYKITFDAIADADTHSEDEYEEYWVVVNFRYENAGAIKWAKELIHVYRPSALTSRITTNFVDVFALEPTLEVHRLPGDMEKFIARAKRDLFRRYRGMGYDRKRMFNLEELNDACLYRAAALACISLYGENASHWLEKFKLYDAAYDEVFAQTKVGYDVEGDDAPAPGETAGGGNIAWLVR